MRWARTGWTRSLVDWLIPRLIWLIHTVLALTIRWEHIGNRYVPGQGQRFLLSMWHALALMIPYAFRGCYCYALVSEHRDGGFIADAINLLGVRTLRGSKTRGGTRAMLQMIRKAKTEGCSLAITPDGPRGPREVVKEGTAQLAMKTGLPVLPICYASKSCWRAGSWDRFYIPKPFSRGVFVYGTYLWVTEDESLASAVARIQTAMDEVQRQADTHFN